MKIWITTHRGSKHAINVRPLIVFDNILDLAKKIYDWWKIKYDKEIEKRINCIKNNYNRNYWETFVPTSFFKYVQRYVEFIVFEAEINKPKKRLNSESVISLLENDKECRKLFTKGMLKE